MKIELTVNEDGTITFNGERYIKAPSIDSTSSDKEATFLELIKGLEQKEDRVKYPNSVFWLKEEKVWFEHDEKNNIFWCSYKNVWLIFKDKYGMEYDDIQGFLNGMVEKHFNCKGVTTRCSFGRLHYLVEKHFNCKGVTTIRRV